EVLHQDKRPIELALEKRLVLCHSAHYASACACWSVEFVQGSLTFGGGRRDSAMLIDCIYELRRGHCFRIQSGELCTGDEFLRKILCVLLKLLLPPGSAHNDILADQLCITYELNEPR